MTPQELFGVLVRFAGFGLIVYGLYTGCWGFTFIYLPHYVIDKNTDEKRLESPSTYLYAAFLFIFLGGFIIAIAGDITRMAYSNASELRSRQAASFD